MGINIRDCTGLTALEAVTAEQIKKRELRIRQCSYGLSRLWIRKRRRIVGKSLTSVKTPKSALNTNQTNIKISALLHKAIITIQGGRVALKKDSSISYSTWIKRSVP